MKKVLLVLLIVLASSSYAAKYKKENIDGSRYKCLAYNHSTGKIYKANVEFYDNEAIIIIGSKYIVVELGKCDIKDVAHIQVSDRKMLVDWELSVELHTVL